MASSPIFNLPMEMIFEILKYLEFPSNIRLKLTCTHFHSIIPYMSLSQLVEAQESQFARLRVLTACAGCLRLRFWPNFSLTKVRTGREITFLASWPHSPDYCNLCNLRRQMDTIESQYVKSKEGLEDSSIAPNKVTKRRR
jgi:hypothetical protein